MHMNFLIQNIFIVRADSMQNSSQLAVVFIGKGGYWEGKAGGRLGWFPARAIQEVAEDGDSGVFSEYCELYVAKVL